MKDFIRGELFEERLRHGCNRNRIADGIEDLNRITYLTSVGGMTVDNSCHVSTLKFFFWNVSSQGDLLKELELHGHLPLSGYKVMNFVIPLLDSFIHTVFTLNATLLGPVNEVLISKYSP